MKHIKEWEEMAELNEGHSQTTAQAPNPDRAEATRELEERIQWDRENGGTLARFRGVQWLNTVTIEQLEEAAHDCRDQWVCLGDVNGSLLYSYCRRD